MIALIATPAFAISANEKLSDPKLEERARKISSGLRCLVCQNQSIDDSDAPLAKDLRRVVRARLEAGDTDDEVENFVVERYGTFVLLKPPFTPGTALLWLAPWVLLCFAIFGVWMAATRRGLAAGYESAKGAGLTDAEQQRLKQLLENDR
ncbi:MAG: cytochrome c-type biogenesis protein [Pseudomonadota bacterium]